MAVKKQDWGLSQRGVKDAMRHRDKIRESIQKNIADIISDASIITRKKGQIVKVPIRGLKSYRFVHRRQGSGGSGVGQGKGDKGDVIGRQPTDGKPGEAGDQPGVDFLETEIDIEELIAMMIEDLGLPNLKKKAFSETVTPKGWKYNSIEKTGLIAHLDKKRSIKEAVKRTAAFAGELMRKTGHSEEDCKKALEMAGGDLLLAEKILKDGILSLGKTGRPISLYTEDLRYRTLKRDVEYESNAVVLAMMDVSGSMGTMKKYLARSFFFWLVEFLRKIYNHVQIRFIAHTTEAKLVDEHEFFHKGESGGTFCHSAYDLAIQLVETEYSPSRWNVYPFHFSDGEDFEPLKTVASAKKLLQMGVNMLGYGEIQAGQYTASHLMEAFGKEFHLEKRTSKEKDFETFFGTDESMPFLGALLKDKSHVYLALKAFLRKERPFRDNHGT